jgi:hypothetical protein
MLRTVLPVSLLALLSTGCDADCADASRLNGTYAMWHTVLNTSTGATVSEDYPGYGVFVNGWSKWKVNWAAGSDTVSADITDVAEGQSGPAGAVGTTQPFSGSFVPSAKDCNAFTMHLDGVFEGTSGSSHLFVYDAELVYMGDHLNGTFAYTDTFTATAEDGSALSGGLTDATGEVQGTLQIDGFDTGFLE